MNIYERRLDAEKYCYLIKFDEAMKNVEHECVGGYSHFHKNVQFLFLTKGNTTVNINGELTDVTQGSILFIDSLEPHSFSSDKIEGYLLILGLWYVEAFNTLFKDRRLPRVMCDLTKNGKVFEFIKTWHDSNTQLSGDELTYDIFLKSNQLFKLLKSAYGIVGKQTISQDLAISSILNYVNEHFQEKITIKEIALKLGYAKEYCSQIFNRYMGESFRQYLNRKRIEKFEQLYATKKDSVPVAQITKECGFDCQATFYRAYKQIHGKTPKNKKNK